MTITAENLLCSNCGQPIVTYQAQGPYDDCAGQPIHLNHRFQCAIRNDVGRIQYATRPKQERIDESRYYDVNEPRQF